MEVLIPPVDQAILRAEVAALRPKDFLMERGGFEVYLTKASQSPALLHEIGRLRELTFRAVGEGTGRAVDIDEYDQYYYNLFIWDTRKEQVVGGYRIGPGKWIFDQYGVDHFYINSLFEIQAEAYPMLRQAAELGRSYIVPEYQKAYLPFFLLWRGILSFLIQHPEYRYLIGPVSISKYYSGLCQSLIVAFVKRYFYDKKMARHFRPRKPFQPQLDAVDLDQMLDTIEGTELKDLEQFINTIEPDHIKVPILLKQYTRLNAKFISFNIDPNFSDALDGLMVLDLQNLPLETLQLLNEK